MDSVPMPDPVADGATKKAGFFRPEDLAAAFPRPLPPTGPWDRGRPSNPAVDAPCKEDALMAALAPYPALRTLAKWRLTLWWYTATLLVRCSVSCAIFAAFCACALAFGGGTFAARQLIGGYALVALYCFAWPATWFAGQIVNGTRNFPHILPTTATAARIFLKMNFWPWPWRNAIHEIMLSEYSILPAWTRCVRDSETSLGHVDGDVECTCSAARCSGALLVNALRHSLAELAVWATLGLALWIFLGWTPLFSLPQVWTHAWSVFLGICFCILFVLFALDPFAYPTPENTMLRLEGRVRRRLVRRALAAFMDRARRAVIAEHPFVSPQELWGSPEEPYMQLHAELRPRWQQAVQSNALPLVYPFFLGLAILLIAASVIIGACIPAWMLAALALFVYHLLRDLWHTAVANSEIASLGELYSSALVETRNLLVAATLPSSVAPDGILLQHLAAHAAALELYAGETHDARRRFLGVAVGFGSFRGLLVSLATVAFAAWGLLRGFGVAATLETVCPG